MYSNKIIVGSDFHLSTKHLKYLDEPFTFFKETIKSEKPLITVINGDYFDSRINADEEIYHMAIRSLIELSTYTKYLIVVEGTFSHDYNTLDILCSYEKFIPNLYFIKHQKVLNLDGLKILCLPEEYPSNPNEYYKGIFEEKYDYILGHGDIEGAIFHSGADNTMLKGFKFKKENLSKSAKYAIFGHYHKHQFLTDNVLYTGSLGRFKFGEEENKGFIIINDIFSNKPYIEFKLTPSIAMDTIVLEDNVSIDEILIKYSLNDEVKFKVSKIDDTKKELLDKLSFCHGKFKIDYIRDDSEDIEDNLVFKDIENLGFNEQFHLMLQYEIDNKKIAKKHVKFFNKNKIDDILNDILIKKNTEKNEL